MASTIYNRYAMVADPTPSAALAAPAFALLPWASGTNIQLKTSSVVSPVMMPNGASAGQQNTAYWVEGSFNGQLMRDPTIDRVMESLFMSAFAAKVLTPGQTEKPFAIEKSFVDGATTYYRQARGLQTTKIDLKWDAEGNVEFSSDFVGLADSRSTTMITSATYADPSTTKKLTGTDVNLILPGVSGPIQMVKGSLSIDMGRKQQTVCGNTYAVGIAASAARKVAYSFSFLKRGFAFETAMLPGSPLSAGLIFGGTDTGYRFDSQSIVFDSPQDEDDEMGQLITVSGVAGYNSTAKADITVTQL